MLSFAFPSTSSSSCCWRWCQRLASSTTSTIFALSSGQPPCAIAVVRLSGDRSEQALRELAKLPATAALQPWRLFRTALYSPTDGRLLDRGMACVMRAPRTFTGEHCAELYLHGSRAVVQAVCAALASMPGLRAAQAGEFTRRAFHNGKLDAAQVEALGDLLHAETDAQLRLSHAQAKAGEYMQPTRERLVRVLARMEARIDFAEDLADEPDCTLAEEFREELDAVGAELGRFVRGARRGQLIRCGLRVALVGRPNVGKSSLLNRLAERDVAIVSNISGTTRDCLETRLELNGQLVNMVDTAGIREHTEDPLEREGIRRTLARASEANIVLLVVDPTNFDQNVDALIAESSIDPACQQLILVLNKSDLVADPAQRQCIEHDLNPGRRFPLVWTCCVRENGLDELLAMLGTQLQNDGNDTADTVAPLGELCLSRERHIHCLERALQHLEETKAALAEWNDPAMGALMLRLCADAVGEIAGSAVVHEQVLDSIFSQFCIGK